MGVGDDFEIGTNTKSDPFFSSINLEPIESTLVSFNGFSDSPYSSLVMENQEMNRIYNDPFGSSYVDMAPSLLSYGKSSNQIAQPCVPHKEIEVAEVVAASHISKRAKTETEPNPSVNQKKSFPNKANASGENLDIVREQNLKTTEKDLKNSTSLLCTQLAEENTYNRNVQSEDSPKEGYVLRARKGQATKGHSLAERLRREKISERMKLLQELVPGCNKITGKAVMLDEIINYVQSLQQQVQFLSMKLATVTPELNYDIQTILSKDIFHSRNGSAPLGGFGLGTNPSHPYGIFQGIPAPNHQFLPFPRARHMVFKTGSMMNSSRNSLQKSLKL